MNIRWPEFRKLTEEEENPFLSGFQTGQDIFSKGLENAFAPRTKAADLKKQELANRIAEVQAKFAEPEAQEELQGKKLDNQKLMKLLPFVEPSARQALISSMLSNEKSQKLMQFVTPQAQADLDLRRGQAGEIPFKNELTRQQADYTGTEAAINRWKMANGIPQEETPEQKRQSALDLNKQKMDQANFLTSMKSAQKNAQEAKDISDLAEQAKYYYGKSRFKGQTAGNLPSSGIGAAINPFSTGNEAVTDRLLGTLQTKIAAKINPVRMTNYLVQFSGLTKPQRNMPEKAFNQYIDIIKSEGDRQSQEPQFRYIANQLGYDDNTTGLLWRAYDNAEPVYDLKNNKPIPKDEKKMIKYLSPEAVSAIRNGDHFAPKGSEKHNPDIPDLANMSKEDLDNLPTDKKIALYRKLTGGG